MGENQEGPTLIENLATVTDAMQTMFPDGKIICIYELNETEFKNFYFKFKNQRLIKPKYKRAAVISPRLFF